MSLLSLNDVDASVGTGILFEEVSLAIDAGEKIGLVGRNGSGKSTFLRLLTGGREPEEGSVTRERDLRIAALDQRPQAKAGLTVDDFLFAARDEPDHEAREATRQRYRVLCTQLGMDDPGKRVETLSGGMLKKIAIARALAFDADLLTLDEPTNHLDLDTVVWLEQRLASLQSAFVLVTHDRFILDSVCTSILEIAEGRVFRHPGSYSDYVRRRAERRQQQDAAEQRRVTILRRELEWLQRGPKARTGKDKGRKDRIETMLDAGVEAEATIGALPVAQRRLGKKVLVMEDVAKSYGDQTVIAGFSREWSPGDRVGVIGPNGSGKTTLLDIIASRVTPDRGRVEPGETTVFAYFDQTGARIDGRKTVLEYITDHAERVRIGPEASVSAEQFLERFLFPRSMFAQPLDRLSGGEFRRLYLVRQLAGAPNFLLLDEPTNDLDLETLRVLEQYLDEFSGCVLLVSHDRALLNRLTDSLLVFEGDGSVTSFVGSYDDYRAARERDRERGRAEAATSRAAPSASGTGEGKGKRVDREPKRGLSFRERGEYDALPDEIAADEEELARLEASFTSATHDPGELEENTKRYHALREEVDRKTARWEELAERAED